MRRTLPFLISLFFIQFLYAQKDAPKWIEKNKKAIFTLITYDNEDNILNTGNGFFITESGVACSDYSLFVGAKRGIIITSEEKEYPIMSILGANDLYEVIKFQVDIDKKVTALTLSSQPLEKGTTVYLLPYSPKKERNYQSSTIEEVSPIAGGYYYYSIPLTYNEKLVSCPLVADNGDVIGMIQRNNPEDISVSYAVDISLGKDLSFKAFSVNEKSMAGIGIKKELPDNEDQALTYLFLNSATTNTEEYLELLNDFVKKFPSSSEGYLRRANHYIYNFKDESSYSKAEQDLNRAENLAENRDNIYYNKARIIYYHALDQIDFKYKDWDLEKAAKENEKAIQIEAQPLYLQQQGDIYFAMQDYAKAFEFYEKVNDTSLASADTYYSTAKTKELMEGDPSEVIELLNKAIATFPTPLTSEAAPYIFERGQYKMDNNLNKEAVADFDLYYRTVNGQVNDLFYYYREQAHYRSNNFSRALEDIEKALTLSPNDPVYIAELGAIYLRLARYQEAISEMEKALKTDPTFAACYRLIGFCQLQLEQKEDACINFAKAKEMGDDAAENMIQKYCNE